MRLVSLRCWSANRTDKAAIKNFALELPEEVRAACELETDKGVQFHYSNPSTAAYWVHFRSKHIGAFELRRVRRAEAEAVNAELNDTIAWSEVAVRQAVQLVLGPVSIF